jgi:exopolyphosphatase/pppGpp-phosphohydrolase
MTGGAVNEAGYVIPDDSIVREASISWKQDGCGKYNEKLQLLADGQVIGEADISSDDGVDRVSFSGLDMQLIAGQGLTVKSVAKTTKGKVNSFVATAGTPTTVAAMKLGQTYETYNASKINGTSLQINDLDFYLKKLLSMPFEEREITVGTGRSDLIAAGILIYKQLYILLEFENCIVIDDGLREGIALYICKSIKKMNSKKKRDTNKCILEL